MADLGGGTSTSIVSPLGSDKNIPTETWQLESALEPFPLYLKVYCCGLNAEPVRFRSLGLGLGAPYVKVAF